MVVLTLPRLVSGREVASDMVLALGPIADGDVVVDARALSAGTGSFAARLVRDVLVTSKASHLVLVGAPIEFGRDVETAAVKLDVRDRLDLSQSMPAPA